MITEKVINYYRFNLLHFYDILSSFVFHFNTSLKIGPLAQAGSAAGF